MLITEATKHPKADILRIIYTILFLSSRG